MRITVSHNKPKEQVMQAVDRSFTSLFQGKEIPLTLVNPVKTWNGSTMTFALTAKMGFLSTPIKGTVEVSDHDVTIDADLGMLERIIPVERAKDLLTDRVHGLLRSPTAK